MTERRRGWSLAVRVVRVLIGVPLCLGSLAILPLSVREGHEYENLVKNGPIQQAVVVSVEKDKWSKYGDVIVKVARPGDGKPIEVEGDYNLDPPPRTGDRIAVVVDPDDPGTIISATVDWSTPWWSYPLILLATAVILTFGLAIAFA